MSNGAKLVLIVLGFFLALTFVRGITVDTDSTEIVFPGNQPAKFSVAVTNTSSTPLKPTFLADGPFTIELSDEDTAAIISAHDSRAYVLELVPAVLFDNGDAYAAQLRVITNQGTQIVPLTLRKGAGEIIPSSKSKAATPPIGIPYPW